MNVLYVDNDDLLKRLCEEYPSVIRLLKIMGVDLDDIEDTGERYIHRCIQEYR